MALHLLLLRHAKSSWDNLDLDDHSRPLSKRGRKAADAMAKYMAGADLRPDTVLCSTAERARRTLDPILDVWPDLDVRYEENLYLASAGQAMNILAIMGAGERVLVVGHNPTMEEMAHRLQDPSRPHDGNAAADLSLKYPTGALAVFELACSSWSTIKPRCARLTHFIKPRDLEKP